MTPAVSLVDALWKITKFLTTREPHCYRSERHSHEGAAEEVASRLSLEGEGLVKWREYYRARTAGMSNYTGD